jgi:voltage-gated potassium channel Kch
MPPFEQYIMAIYFTITTMTTVGYGDISPNTTVEMVFGISIMVIGVLVFTFISGSLSSIIQNVDSSTA